MRGMRSKRALILPIVVLCGAAVLSQGRGRGGGNSQQIKPGEECPPGTTETRPRVCEGPSTPAPSILDYRPKSTLVVPEHPVPRAKFPAIDFHGHPRNLVSSSEGLASLGDALDSLNVGLIVVAENLTGERLQSVVAAVGSSAKMKNRVRPFAGVNLRDVGPGWAEKAIAQLEADVAAGAVGVGEIGGSFGESVRKRDGTRLQLDDPELKPLWAACARLKLPVFIHTGYPQEFYRTVDYTNERWLELSLFPERRVTPDEGLRFNELMAERDQLFRQNPKTTFVAAHMGWHANDLGRLGKLFDELPNVNAEVGAVLYDIGRQPRVARDFFIKYQDRILFGKDSFQPEEYPYYWRVFETRDDYFDYYRHYHAFWRLYGIDLPDEVLKKVYYKNALRITPGLPQTGWPK